MMKSLIVEMAIVLPEHKRSYDGSEALWPHLLRLYSDVGFSRLVLDAGGKTAGAHLRKRNELQPSELDAGTGGGRAGLRNGRHGGFDPKPPIMDIFLQRPVTITDNHRTWWRKFRLLGCGRISRL